MKRQKKSEFLTDFEKLTEIGYDLSMQFQGVYAPTRRLGYSTRFLARIIECCFSILQLIPNSKFAGKKLEYLDFHSVASLLRDLIEACNHGWYLTIEKVDEFDEELRLAIYDYHDMSEMKTFAKQMGFVKTDFDYIDKELEQHRKIIENNPHFKTLDKHTQKLIVNGKQGTLHTQFQIATRRRIKLDKFKAIYKLLSIQTHTSPSSMRMLLFAKQHDPKNELQEILKVLLIEYCNRFIASTIWNTSKIWKIQFAIEDSRNLVKKYNRRITLS